MATEVLEKRKPGPPLSQRSIEILGELRYKSQSEVARAFGVSRQRVNQLKNKIIPMELMDLDKAKLQDWELEDTGCLDGVYLSCLKCPLKKCREDT